MPVVNKKKRTNQIEYTLKGGVPVLTHSSVIQTRGSEKGKVVYTKERERDAI